MGLGALSIAPSASAVPTESAYLDEVDTQLPKVSQQIDSTVLLNLASEVCGQLYLGHSRGSVNDAVAGQFAQKGWPRSTGVTLVSLSVKYFCPEEATR